ncbi:MAG: anhydro-N-acetylmuramic acid kinase [Ignavibacteria bacterium]|nr:anhydro-N-acetylmuramic acid kinase [Ignavibacteria bacterium]
MKGQKKCLSNSQNQKWIGSPEIWLSEPRTILGIMTGTSVDGADAVIAEFEYHPDNSNFPFKINRFVHKHFPLHKKLKQKIIQAINNNANTSEISFLNTYLAYYYAEIVKKMKYFYQPKLPKVDAVAVHGQTVWHSPLSKKQQSTIGHSLQLCSLPTLATLTNLPVVGDFRSKDIALGGQGAPIVPIFDYYFLRRKEENIITLNIGGIANVTILPKSCNIDNILAFDTGPGNSWIDLATNYLFGLPFDRDGKIAKSGALNPQLFNLLSKINYIRKKPPKSTGKELFGEKELKKYLEFSKRNSINRNDIITTLTHYTAWSIATNIEEYIKDTTTVIVSGGGALNMFLTELLRSYLPSNTKLILYENGKKKYLLGKEALAIAFLGYLRLGCIPSNFPSVTGAKQRTSLGIVVM